MSGAARIDAPEPGGILRAAQRGLGWKLAAQVVDQVVRLGGILVLARLLTPHEYGLAGMALAVAVVIGVLADPGIGTALVRRPSLTDVERSTAFWTSAALGVIGALLLAAAVRPVAALYDEPEVERLLLALALSFPLVSLGATHAALLTRELAFARLATITMTAGLGGVAAGVAVAAGGGGAWSLVAMQLVGAAISLAALWLALRWRPRRTFSLPVLRELVRFAANLLGARLLFAAHRNADNVLVGRYVGAAGLGAYALAYNLVLLPFGRLVDPVRAVLLPILARVQDDPARMASLWVRATRLLVALLVPAMVGLAVVAPDVVPLVLGERWRDAVPVLQVLAGVGMLQSFITLNSVILPIVDRADALFRFGVLSFVLAVAGFVAGLPYGITGVAVGYLAANAIFTPVYVRMTARSIGARPLDLVRSAAPVLLASALVALTLLAVRLALVAADVPPAARTVAVVLVGFAAYAALVSGLAPDVREDFRRVLARRKP